MVTKMQSLKYILAFEAVTLLVLGILLVALDDVTTLARVVGAILLASVPLVLVGGVYAQPLARSLGLCK